MQQSTDVSNPHCQSGRAWVDEAIRRVSADANRSADTHLIPLRLPDPWPEWGIDVYLKDESTHPTGSLKHRLARSLFLYGLCNGWIREGTTIVEASSGSTAVSEAYFARMLGLPFVAVMPRSTSKEKCELIEFQGGRVPLRGRPRRAVRGGAAGRRLGAGRVRRRALHGPVHLRRAGHRLARQQQHRGVDLRADGAGAASRARAGSWSAPGPAVRPRRSAATSATSGTPPGCASWTRRTRRSSRAGATTTRPTSPARARASRGSAGRVWSPRSSPMSWTG